jgi:hypothetical protein
MHGDGDGVQMHGAYAGSTWSATTVDAPFTSSCAAASAAMAAGPGRIRFLPLLPLLRVRDLPLLV